MIGPNGKKGAFLFGFDLDVDTIWNEKIVGFENGNNFIRSRSTGMYGICRGMENILALLDKYDIKSTFYVPAIIAKMYPEKVRMIIEHGHEVAHHGEYHQSNYGATLEEQLKTLEDCQQIFEDVFGRRACGFRFTGYLLPETYAEFFKKDEVLYISQENTNDEIRFMPTVDGVSNVVNIPCRMEVDDYVQTVFNLFPAVPKGLDRIGGYADILDNFKTVIDAAREYGQVVSTAFHPQISGSQGRLYVLEEMIKYIKENDIWTGRSCDLAAFWKEQQEKGGECR